MGLKKTTVIIIIIIMKTKSENLQLLLVTVGDSLCIYLDQMLVCVKSNHESSPFQPN